MHGNMKEEIVKYFVDIRYVTVTADSWTSENGLGLLGVTAHWVDCNWQYRETVLALRELPDTHDGHGLATVLYDIITEFKLRSKVFVFLVFILNTYIY